LVYVCFKFLDEALHDRQMPMLGCKVQGRGAIVCCFVDVCTELLDEALHDRLHFRFELQRPGA
jgi:hypothetical protein